MHTSCYLTHTQQNSHSTWLRKDVGMYVHHEVSSCCVLHDKTHMFWCLETCKQVDQEGVVGAVDSLKDPLLTHQTGNRQRARAGWGGGAWDSSNWALSCGWDTRLKSQNSVINKSYLSTSSLATMSPFFRALMAYRLPVFLYSDNKTWREQKCVLQSLTLCLLWRHKS